MGKVLMTPDLVLVDYYFVKNKSRKVYTRLEQIIHKNDLGSRMSFSDIYYLIRILIKHAPNEAKKIEYAALAKKNSGFTEPYNKRLNEKWIMDNYRNNMDDRSAYYNVLYYYKYIMNKTILNITLERIKREISKPDSNKAYLDYMINDVIYFNDKEYNDKLFEILKPSDSTYSKLLYFDLLFEQMGHK